MILSFLGKNCDRWVLQNGNVNDENRHLVPGVKVDIDCFPGYYLWGANSSTCLPSLRWSQVSECMNISKFKRECELDGQVMKIRDQSPFTPYCFAG